MAARQLPIWSVPLAPVALALTAGILLDRFCVVPLAASLVVGLASLLAWVIFFNTSRQWLALAYLMGGVAGAGSAYHHWHRHHVAATDLSRVAERESQPARVRGVLASAPITRGGESGPLRSFPTQATTRFVLRVQARQDLARHAWQEANGMTQVTLIGRTDDVTVGDEVELLGRLALPSDASNPGEFDYAAFLHDQGITTTLTVLQSDEVIFVRRGWPTSLFGLLAVARGWGQRTLARDLPTQQGVASALLLGEGADMSGEDWEQYLRTGVIHVLAISGQHLVILAGVLWLVARVSGFRRRYAAPAIALLLIGYALLTGGRPPVMRAAWVMAAFAGGTLLQRPTSYANSFALAWIGVIAVNPCHIFNAGCQLSFLAVAVLVWGVGRWGGAPGDPLQARIDAARSWPTAVGVCLLRWIGMAYAVNAAVWLALTPLVAYHYHIVSPIALVLGPPMVLLTTIALLAGFGFLIFAAWAWPIAWVFGLVTQASLTGCEILVTLGQRLPGAYFFVADVPVWWLWIFYLALLVGMTLPIVWRHGRWALLAAGVWLMLGVLLQLWPHRPGELRCTFVAVGHGGCTVIETPAGRVIVYDAGATGGPDVTRRYIAPFLWSRGIRRIDDLILSHADLDHFNGVPQLAERFAIDRVVCTPTFAERSLLAVQRTVSALEERAIPMEIVHAGQRWQADGVSFEVLHPPAQGPAGKENVRSLVLLVRHGKWSMLLTGDLEEAGLTQVLAKNPPTIDVLMAPHHGSDRSNIPALANWAKPKLVVSCQTAPTSERASVRMYEKMGAKYLGTWPHGAITIRPNDVEAPVRTFRTRLELRPW
jgi:competence protein ComEC